MSSTYFIFLIALICLIGGGVVGYLVTLTRKQYEVDQLKATVAHLSNQKNNQSTQTQQEQLQAQKEHDELNSQLNATKAKLTQTEAQLANVRAQLKETGAQLTKTEAQLTKAQATIASYPIYDKSSAQLHIDHFLQTSCHLYRNGSKKHFVTLSQLYERYQQYTYRSGDEPLDRRVFSRLLKKAGVQHGRKYVEGKQERVVWNIRLLSPTLSN